MSEPVLIERRGVLSGRQIERLSDRKVISELRAKPDPDASALDLHLGVEYWESDFTVKQCRADDTVEQVLAEMEASKKGMGRAGLVVEPGRVYVIKLAEKLNLSDHPWLHARATGKSSIGRVDVLTRLLVNGHSPYDEVPAEYAGPLFVEVLPITFRVRFRTGDSINQLRFFSGSPGSCELSDTGSRTLLYAGESGGRDWRNQAGRLLTVDLTPDAKTGAVAFRARSREDVRGVDPIDWRESRNERLDPRLFFTAETSERERLRLEKDSFYIMRSRERLSLSRDIAVTGLAYAETVGELRIHYAGFAHPYFGKLRKGPRPGTPLIFEVRAHSTDVILRHEEILAHIIFYRMSEPADRPDEQGYSEQELTLSKVFREIDPSEWGLR